MSEMTNDAQITQITAWEKSPVQDFFGGEGGGSLELIVTPVWNSCPLGENSEVQPSEAGQRWRGNVQLFVAR